MPDGEVDQNYLNKGATFQGDLLSFSVLVPGVGTGIRNTSATFLNSRYALTNAQNVTDLLQFKPSYEVATGPNYLSNRGTVIPVEKVTVYPGYDGSRNTPDLAIIKFAVDVPSFNANAIGMTSPNEIMSAAGFGFATRPSDPVPTTRDGNRRGWDGRLISDFPPIDASATYYQSTSFSEIEVFLGVPLLGKGLSGDSGGPVFNSAGQLVGLNTAQSGDTSTAGTSIFLNLSQPDVYNWIQANTVVPEPTSAGRVCAAAAGLLARRRRTPFPNA